tara:strand:- start:241 stop:414 length:174 start_codon:yes stop_codon:yes gene_type:complete
MPIRKIKTKNFKLQKEASTWAKKEKKKAGPQASLKWETNRTKNPDMPWEAILFKDVE